jgi:hypothetical protein
MIEPGHEPCATCGGPIDESDRLLLVVGRRRQSHCSPRCLEENVGRQRRARRTVRRRLAAVVSGLSILSASAAVAWFRFRAPPAQSISYQTPDEIEADPPPAPPVYGPPWPPRDEDWSRLFAKASWVHPLPGPKHRAASSHDRIVAPDARARRAYCQPEGRCGVETIALAASTSA